MKMINVLYIDNHLLVVEKPRNMLVQSDITKDIDLLTTLKEYIKEKYQKPGNVYLGLVHRLDRVVGGVMVFARTSKSASRLSKQITNNEFTKIYYAVLDGSLKTNGNLTNYLKKNEKTNTSYVSKDGKLAILDYEVLKIVDNKTLVKIKLKTGRHHQIRVQFMNFGYPLVGDNKYNKNCDSKNIALFAKSLSFKHPITNEILTFELDLPNIYPFNIF